jgi:hypothetical protein
LKEIQDHENSSTSIFVSLAVLFVLIATFSYVAISPDIAADGEYSQYAVMFTPSTNYKQAFNHIVRAGGKPIRGGNLEFIMVAASKNPDFKNRVKKQGALFLFNPIILGGCSIEKRPPIKT